MRDIPSRSETYITIRRLICLFPISSQTVKISPPPDLKGLHRTSSAASDPWGRSEGDADQGAFAESQLYIDVSTCFHHVPSFLAYLLPQRLVADNDTG